MTSFASAQSPRIISYQGRLTDDTGAPLDTVADLTFRIYAEEIGGSPVWSQTHSDAEITDGLFHVALTLYGNERWWPW